MKILRVIPSMDPATGGPCQGIRNLTPALRALGAETEVVCLDDPAAGFFATQKDDFIIHALGRPSTPWQYNKHLLPWLEANLPRFDIVVVHGLWLYHGFAVRKAIKTLKAANADRVPKWFMMPHGMLDPYFQTDGGRKLKAYRNKVYWSLIEGRNIHQADGILFTCAEEMRLAAHTFGHYAPKQTVDIGYGIQPPPDVPPETAADVLATHTIPSDDPYILFLSRIHEKKGVDMLLSAYADIVRTASPGDHLPNLVIAGPVEQPALGEAIRTTLADNPPLSRKVFLTGMVTGVHKWGLLQRASAFALPSHQENFGIAVVEALACRVPVLISDKVNIWPEISEAGAGLVAGDDAAGTRTLLDRWIAMPDAEKNSRRTAAYDCFHQRFDARAAARRQVEFFNTQIA